MLKIDGDRIHSCFNCAAVGTAKARVPAFGLDNLGRGGGILLVLGLDLTKRPHGSVNGQIGGDGIEATEIDDASARLGGHGSELGPHLSSPVRLAGNINVVGSGRSAR